MSFISPKLFLAAAALALGTASGAFGAPSTLAETEIYGRWVTMGWETPTWEVVDSDSDPSMAILNNVHGGSTYGSFNASAQAQSALGTAKAYASLNYNYVGGTGAQEVYGFYSRAMSYYEESITISSTTTNASSIEVQYSLNGAYSLASGQMNYNYVNYDCAVLNGGYFLGGDNMHLNSTTLHGGSIAAGPFSETYTARVEGVQVGIAVDLGVTLQLELYGQGYITAQAGNATLDFYNTAVRQFISLYDDQDNFLAKFDSTLAMVDYNHTLFPTAAPDFQVQVLSTPEPSTLLLVGLAGLTLLHRRRRA